MRSLLMSVLLLFCLSCEAPPDRLPGDATMEPPPQGAFDVQLDGSLVHYEVHGNGPPLMVMPNSWGLSHEGLRGLFGALETYLTLIYFDPRGMGRSGPLVVPADMGPDAVREDFDRLRRHMGLDRVSVIGWSNGASNLLLLAADHPEAVVNAIFVHGVASFSPEDGVKLREEYGPLFEEFSRFGAEMQAQTDLTPEQQDARVKQFDLDVWFPWLLADRERGLATMHRAFETAQFSWTHAMYTQQVWAQVDFRARLSEIEARSLIIAGQHDMTPPEASRVMASGIPNARLAIFEKSGHFAPIEEPEHFRNTVLEFLAPGAP